MSKITVITNTAGEIVAIGHGHISEQTAKKSRSSRPQGGLRADPGQQLHEIDTPEDLQHIDTWTELHNKVKPLIKLP